MKTKEEDLDKILLENGACIEVEKSKDSINPKFFIKFRFLWLGDFPDEKLTEITDKFYDTLNYENGKNGTYYRMRTSSGKTPSVKKQSYATDIAANCHCYMEEECQESDISSFRQFLSFSFKRWTRNDGNLYVDKLTDEGMGHYGLLTYRWLMPIDSSDKFLDLIGLIHRAKAELRSQISPTETLFPTFTKFMYAMQCRKETYSVYHDVFAQTDPAVVTVEKTLDQFENKIEITAHMSKYMCYAQDVVSRYYQYFTNGLSQEESNDLISSIVKDVEDGIITYELDNGKELIC